MRTHLLYIVICLLGVCAIVLRCVSLHYASRGALIAASAATMVSTAKAQTQDEAVSIATYSGAINLCSLAVALVGGALYSVARMRQHTDHLAPVLLLIVYAVLFFVDV